MATHPLQCTCKTLIGEIDAAARFNRGLCFCKDCQAFAHFLGRAPEILDDRGGTGIVQTQPSMVRLTAGQSQLACVRLTPNGLTRWYTKCCNTPIGNTPANYKFAFVGLIDMCLKSPPQSLDERYGPVEMWVHTQSAIGDPKPRTQGTLRAIRHLMGGLISARVTGRYKRTPFFSARGELVAVPTILAGDQRAAIMAAVNGYR